MKKAITLQDIYLGNEPPERVVIPAGTEVVIEHEYAETLDVVAYADDIASSQYFWVWPTEIEQEGATS